MNNKLLYNFKVMYALLLVSTEQFYNKLHNITITMFKSGFI